MRVPFLDLQAQYASIKDEVDSRIREVLDNSAYVLGPAVEHFEGQFAGYCQTSHCIGCSSGTAALHLALRALDVGPGDEVITTPHTFIASVWAISYVGATPVFVDIDPHTYTINPELIEKRITSRTAAILPIHLYGQPADMDPIVNVARRHNLPVVEDSAQAHGAEYKGQRCGSLGDVASFSFYPGKNLGAYGEAGAIVTDDAQIAERIRRLRNHAQSEKYVHAEIGYNYRMDGIQGSVLGVKLRYLNEWNEARRQVAQRYRELLGEWFSDGIPHEADYAKHVYHLFELQLSSKAERDDLRVHLDERAVQTGLHYPTPVHLQQAYQHLGHDPGSFPNAERSAECNLSLPMFPEMTKEQVQAVGNKIISWCQSHEQ